MPDRVAVSSADFIRSIGFWQSEALRHPISITHHGRERLVLATPDRFVETSTISAVSSSLNDVDIRALRAELSALLEHTDEGFIAIDESLNICGANALAEAFLGRTRSDLVDTRVLECFPQPLASLISERLQRVVRSKKPEMFEAGAFDGRYLAVRVFPYGEGAAILFNNLTEQRAMHSRLEESEALQAALLAHSNAATLRLDARARVESLATIFCDWTGFAGAEVIGHRFVDMVAAPARRETAEAIETVLRRGEPEETELVFLGKRGEEIPCSLSIAPILTDFVARGVIVLCTRTPINSAQRAA